MLFLESATSPIKFTYFSGQSCRPTERNEVLVGFHPSFFRHGITRASSVLLIWLNENVRSRRSPLRLRTHNQPSAQQSNEICSESNDRFGIIRTMDVITSLLRSQHLGCLPCRFVEHLVVHHLERSQQHQVEHRHRLERKALE